MNIFCVSNFRYVIVLLLLASVEIISAQTPQDTNPLYQQTLSTLNKVESEGNIAGNFPGEDASLPMGISKTIAGTNYIIAVDSAVFFSTQTLCSAYMAIDLPGAMDKIAFAAKNIGVNPKGVMSTNNSRLLLVSEHKINISQNIKLFLKNDGSNYVEWDCNGFKTVNLKGYFEFSDNIIIPDSGSITPNGKVIASFEIHTNDIHNFITQVSISPFCLKSMKDVSFTVMDATVDLSELANASTMVFPNGYQQSTSNIVEWQGFYLKQFTIKLPKELSKKNQGRTSIYASNLLIDNSGVSGTIGATNILSLGDSDMGGWQLSISQLEIKILQNHLNGGGISGTFKIPIFENNALVYSASFLENQSTKQIDYQFIANAQSNLQASVLSATIDLYPSSKIIINKTAGKFLPRADLTGQLKLNANAASTGKLDFQQVIITSQQPYLQSGTFSFTSADSGSNKVGKFPISINKIEVVIHPTNPNIYFQVGLNFMKASDQGFAASAGFRVLTKFIPDNNSSNLKWKFDRIRVEDISLDIQTQAFKLKGYVSFRENNPVYGNGFAGGLNILIPQVGLGIDINAIFGAKDNYKYFYVDGTLQLPTPILVASGIGIYRFMGGLYYHMKQPIGNDDALYTSAFTSNAPPNYIPDENIGIGFKAGVTLGIMGKEDAFNGDVALEVQFNSSSSGGGLSLIKFTGDCFFMTSIADRIGKTYTQVPVGAFVYIGYDFNKPEFNAVLNVSINYQGVSGVVNSLFHVDNKDWYLYIGKPSQRGIITIQNMATVTSYFMVGNKIEPMPDLPSQIAAVFGKPNNRNTTELESAKGFAFGAELSMGTSKEFGFDFFTVYGNANFTLGFDLMMQKYASTFICPNTGTNPGFKGWHLKGQLYAYLNANIGIKGEFVHQSFDFTICSFSAATMLYGELMKPTYIEGHLTCSYDILNGAVKGSFQYDFEKGTKCSG